MNLILNDIQIVMDEESANNGLIVLSKDREVKNSERWVVNILSRNDVEKMYEYLKSINGK